jgi:2-amino-4-hydroxy-6-hydroxymethyldihydropteridine diphosphokinase
MTHSVYIGLGTNLGDRLENLRNALAALPPKVTVLAESAIYETPPWGYADQPDYLNMAVRAATDLPPLELLALLKAIEQAQGRLPTFRYGPRPIDLDILFYGDLVLESPQLVIPHPRLHERGFMLVPLADLNPDLLHPLLGYTVFDMLAQADLSGITPISF